MDDKIKFYFLPEIYDKIEVVTHQDSLSHSKYYMNKSIASDIENDLSRVLPLSQRYVRLPVRMVVGSVLIGNKGE